MPVQCQVFAIYITISLLQNELYQPSRGAYAGARVCLCVHVCAFACACMCARACMLVYLCVHIYMYIDTRGRARECVYVCKCLCGFFV